MTTVKAKHEIFDTDTERLILGSMLLEPDSMDALRSTMALEDFGLLRHQNIWTVACDLYDSGTEIGRIPIGMEMRKRGMEANEILSYLSDLEDTGIALPSLDRYIQKLKDSALLRRIAAIGENIHQRALSGLERGDELRDALGTSLSEMSNSGPKERCPVSTTDLVDKIGIEGLLSPSRSEGVRLPWSRLNTALGGLRNGQSVVLAADTGRGKTSFALQVATHAVRQGKSVLYWTMEMPPESLFKRIVTQMTGMDRKSSTPTFQQREAEREAVGLLYDNPIFFDSTSRTVPAFCASLRQIRQRARIGLVVVDYLGLIRSAGRAESRTREVGENSRSLKLAAMDFSLPFLVLSQFSRPKDNQRPTIHSLKESGDVENDADVILLLISGEFSPENPTPVALNIGKQREGVAGFDVNLMFHPRSQTFESVED